MSKDKDSCYNWALFEKKVQKTAECWIWTGAKNRDGYGVFHRTDNKAVRAHRVSFEVLVGPIPVGKGVLHRCDTPACVRPDHLFLGTQLDNIRDMKIKGRGKWGGPSPSGEAHYLAKLTAAQVAAIREEYVLGKISQHALAKKYGVSQATICSALSRQTWRSA